jgi:glucose-6-phosphate isomerase
MSSWLAQFSGEAPGMAVALERLRRDDALGQLLERGGRMAALAVDGGDLKLDWVDRLAWLLAHPDAISGIDELARSIQDAGARHLMWAGMGGSVQTIHALNELGLLKNAEPVIRPLDSTDPAALNRMVRMIAREGELRTSLGKSQMIGVSMGMTSEEPITHLEWFESLLSMHGVASPGAQMMVMTLPGSFLDQFAERRAARRLRLQPDGGNGTPGRMSAPSTMVFLLPAALIVGPGRLLPVLQRCQKEYRLRPGTSRVERSRIIDSDPFVNLGAWLSAQIDEGRDMVVLDLPERWRGLASWVEQVVEESLGKSGRGLLVFHGQDLSWARDWPDRFSVLRIDEGAGVSVPGRPLAVLELDQAGDASARLSVLARFFAGWNLAVAMVGYLQNIVFAGQPAVETYKRYARELRDSPGRLPFPEDDLATSADGRLSLYFGALRDIGDFSGYSVSGVLAAAVEQLHQLGRLGYFDLTVNADPSGQLWECSRALALNFGNRVLRCPVKVRSGPRDYHSTEQSETDGPPDVFSVRVVLREYESVAAGHYSPRFLHAQALGTVLAMRDAGRPVLLCSLENASSTESLEELFASATERLTHT